MVSKIEKNAEILIYMVERVLTIFKLNWKIGFTYNLKWKWIFNLSIKLNKILNLAMMLS